MKMKEVAVIVEGGITPKDKTFIMDKIINALNKEGFEVTRRKESAYSDTVAVNFSNASIEPSPQDEAAEEIAKHFRKCIAERDGKVPKETFDMNGKTVDDGITVPIRSLKKLTGAAAGISPNALCGQSTRYLPSTLIEKMHSSLGSGASRGGIEPYSCPH